MTQSILSAMDSDEVNTIVNDANVEARQVVSIIEDTYYDLMLNHVDWNHLKSVVQLDSLSDSNFPSTLKIPNDVVRIEKIRYDIRKPEDEYAKYSTRTYLPPQDFLDKVLERDADNDAVEIYHVKGTNTPIFIYNDREPTYWTSFDEEYITFDAYDSSVDSTLRGSKSMTYAVSIPTFNPNSDTYIPDCPIQFFPTLLAESKKACFAYLKQGVSPVDEKRSLRGLNKIKGKGYNAHSRRYIRRFGRR